MIKFKPLPTKQEHQITANDLAAYYAINASGVEIILEEVETYIPKYSKQLQGYTHDAFQEPIYKKVYDGSVPSHYLRIIIQAPHLKLEPGIIDFTGFDYKHQPNKDIYKTHVRQYNDRVHALCDEIKRMFGCEPVNVILRYLGR